jgi:signal recognition particle subunit SRP54
MMVIMKSMTPKELDCKVAIDHSRLIRIARGSGSHPNEVAELLAQHKQFEKMFDGMNKAGLLEGDDKALAKKMQKNPGQMSSILGSVMDPALIKQVRGYLSQIAANELCALSAFLALSVVRIRWAARLG